MPGFTSYGRVGGVFPSPDIMPYDIGDAQTINIGDLVVAKSNVSGATTIRPLAAADKTAHYLVSAADAGVLGVAMGDIVTNSAGLPTGKAPYGGSIAMGGVIYPTPGYAGSLGTDPATGFSMDAIALATNDQFFEAALDSTSAVASKSLIGTKAGIIISTVNGQNMYTIDTNAAAADQIVVIRGVDEQDQLFGSHGGHVIVQFLFAYQQSNNGVLYAS